MLSNKAIVKTTVILVLISFILLPLLGLGQKTGTKKYTVNSHGLVNLCGKKFTYSKGAVDTIEIEEKNEQPVQKVIKTEGYPLKMDGKDIYDERPVFNVPVEAYLYKRMKSELTFLDDGYYNLGVYNIIIDDKGMTCAFSYDGISGKKTEADLESEPLIAIDKKKKEKIFDKVCNVLANFPAYEPAVVNGKKVVSVSNPIYPNQFKMQKHKIYLKKKNSWQEL